MAARGRTWPAQAQAPTWRIGFPSRRLRPIEQLPVPYLRRLPVPGLGKRRRIGPRGCGGRPGGWPQREEADRRADRYQRYGNKQADVIAIKVGMRRTGAVL